MATLPPLPSPQHQVTEQSRAPDRIWYTWLSELDRAVRGAPQLASYTVATLPAASPAGLMIYVTDESGGAVPAFSDGTNWRRVTDRQQVS